MGQKWVKPLNIGLEIIKLLEENPNKILQDLIRTNTLGTKTQKSTGNRAKYKEIGLHQTKIYIEGENSTEWRDDRQDRQCCHLQLNRRYQEIHCWGNKPDTERQTFLWHLRRVGKKIYLNVEWWFLKAWKSRGGHGNKGMLGSGYQKYSEVEKMSVMYTRV